MKYVKEPYTCMHRPCASIPNFTRTVLNSLRERNSFKQF